MVPAESLDMGFLLAFHSNYGGIFNCFGIIHERDSHPATTSAYCIASRSKNQSIKQSINKNVRFSTSFHRHLP